ncbi:hypothetical protein Tcan_02916 [Toxocara canis]|uniref:Uncharacterized protein n=1 Tax=Toxocara canis TaxID=6265 RepID=A0A0B2V2V2_TOXCA|nr:hypothetical protein Tcan_02916 [Toxocara canis]
MIRYNSEGEVASITGIITHIDSDQRKARFWTVDLAEEIVIVGQPEEISKFEVGTWISVPADEIRKRSIENFFLAEEPVPTKVVTVKGRNGSRIKLKVCLAFPPSEWAESNGYTLLAYSDRIGVVGNFASQKLVEINGPIERDICYEAEIASFSNRDLSQKYRTIWAVMPQKLKRIDNKSFLATCPWRCDRDEGTADGCEEGISVRSFANESKESIGYEEGNAAKQEEPSPEKSVFSEQDTSRDPIPVVVASANAQGMDEDKQSMMVGIIVKCEEHCTLVFGKQHGLIMVSQNAELSLALGEWVSYECIPAEEPVLNGVKYLAVSCHAADNRPRVSKVTDGIVQVCLFSLKVDYSFDPIPVVVASANAQGMDEDKQSMMVGIIVKCEEHCTLVFGKQHGLIMVSQNAELSLALGEWVSYECIPAEEPVLNGVKYLAVSCHAADNRPRVSKVTDGIVQVFTDVSCSLESEVTPPDGFIVMKCSLLGFVLAPNSSIVLDAITKGGTIYSIVEFGCNNHSGFLWRVKSVYKDGIPVPADDGYERDTCWRAECSAVSSERDSELSFNSAVEVTQWQPEQRSAPYEPSSPSTSSRCDEESTTSNDVRQQRTLVRKGNDHHLQALQEESTESLVAQLLSIYRASSKKKKACWKVPFAIFVRKSSTYGIVWSFRYKSIVVLKEHLSDIDVGTWIKTKITDVWDDNEYLRYRYVTVAPIVQIADKLPLRCQDGIVKVQIHLESGGKEVIDNGHHYLSKNSEVGSVLLHGDKMSLDVQQKRFLTWATFVQQSESFPWMVLHQEFLIEIDEQGTPINQQPIARRRYNIEEVMDDDEIEMKVSGDEPSSCEPIASVSRMIRLSSEEQVSSKRGQPEIALYPEQCKQLFDHLEVRMWPVRAMNKIFYDCRIRKFLLEIGYERELDIVLNWLCSEHSNKRRSSM